MDIGKNRARVRGLAALGGLLLLTAAGCASRPAAAPAAVLKADDPLFGTWVNEEAEKLGRGAAAKSVFFPDGRELVFQHITDTEPVGESRDTVEKAWIDSEGNHWYHIHWVGWGYDDPEKKWEGFSLVKVNAAGTVQEGMWNRFGYPEELDPLSPNYGILYRQETAAAPAPVLKADDPLLGTWVNEEYGGVSNMRSQKVVIFAEGRELDYRNIPDTEPEFEGRFTVEETWVDEEGSRWYKTRYKANYYPYRDQESWGGYGLTRVNAEGTVLEGVSAGAGYPEEMSVIGGDYGVYYRQE